LLWEWRSKHAVTPPSIDKRLISSFIAIKCGCSSLLGFFQHLFISIPLRSQRKFPWSTPSTFTMGNMRKVKFCNSQSFSTLGYLINSRIIASAKKEDQTSPGCCLAKISIVFWAGTGPDIVTSGTCVLVRE